MEGRWAGEEKERETGFALIHILIPALNGVHRPQIQNSSSFLEAAGAPSTSPSQHRLSPPTSEALRQGCVLTDPLHHSCFSVGKDRSTVNGHLGGFPLLGSYEYLNILVHVLRWTCGWISLGVVLGVELPGHRVHIYSALVNTKVGVPCTLPSAMYGRSGCFTSLPT